MEAPVSVVPKVGATATSSVEASTWNVSEVTVHGPGRVVAGPDACGSIGPPAVPLPTEYTRRVTPLAVRVRTLVSGPDGDLGAGHHAVRPARGAGDQGLCTPPLGCVAAVCVVV